MADLAIDLLATDRRGQRHGRDQFACLQRVVDRIRPDQEDEIIKASTKAVENLSRNNVNALHPLANRLAGAAATLADARSRKHASSIETLTANPQLALMEDRNHDSTLHYAIRDIALALGRMAVNHPDDIVSLMTDVAYGVWDTHPSLAAALVRGLGEATNTPRSLALMIPFAYRALTAQSQVLRASGRKSHLGKGELFLIYCMSRLPSSSTTHT